jgi:hypothetical protein
MSSSLNKLENDLWLRLSDLKCQNNFTQQIRSNQRNHLVSLNEQYQRRVSQIQLKKKNSSTSILIFFPEEIN